MLNNNIWNHLTVYKQMVGWLAGFYDVSTFEGYLTPNPVYM